MKRALLVVLTTLMVLAAATVAQTLVLTAQGTGSLPPLDPRVVVWDKGPARIDVSKYPPEMKKEYKLFTDVCGTCHSIARAVNCDFATEDDWERYIKRMMRRAGPLVPPAQAERIFAFAVFDSKIRKKDLYERRMKEAGAR